MMRGFPVRRRAAWAVMVCSLAVLTGCALSDDYEDSRDIIQERATEAAALNETAKTVEDPRGLGPVREHLGVYLGGQPIVSRNGAPLPKKFEAEKGVTLRTANGGVTLQEVAAQVGRMTGIPITVDRLWIKGGGTNAGGAKVSVDSAGNASGTPSPGAAAAAPQAAAESSVERHSITWQGPLSGLLDQIATSYDVSWEYEGGVITLFRFKTETFTIAALPSDSSIVSRVTSGSDSSSSGGSGGSQQGSVSVTSEQSSINGAELDYWKELGTTLEGVVPAEGVVSVSRSAGTVTVTSTPSVLRRVRELIDHQNDALTRQVSVSVQVYAVTLDKESEYGVDLSLLFQDTNFKLSLVSPSSQISSAAGKLTAGVLSAPTDSLAGKFADTSAILSALRTKGDTSLVTTLTLTTLNGRPATDQVVEQQGFLKERSVTVTEGSSSTSEALTPGTIITGFTLTVLPRVFEGGRLALGYTINLSELIELSQIGGDDTFIQVPKVASRTFQQEALLRSGQTLVLTGFEQTNDKAGNREFANILTSAETSETTKTLIVIALRPVVVQG